MGLTFTFIASIIELQFKPTKIKGDVRVRHRTLGVLLRRAILVPDIIIIFEDDIFPCCSYNILKNSSLTLRSIFQSNPLRSLAADDPYIPRRR